MSIKRSVKNILASRPNVIPIHVAQHDLEKKSARDLRKLAAEGNEQGRLEYWQHIELMDGFHHEAPPPPQPDPPVHLPPVPKRREVFGKPRVRAESWTAIVARLQEVTNQETDGVIA